MKKLRGDSLLVRFKPKNSSGLLIGMNRVDQNRAGRVPPLLHQRCALATMLEYGNVIGSALFQMSRHDESHGVVVAIFVADAEDESMEGFIHFRLALSRA
jgi:hypothetical protein